MVNKVAIGCMVDTDVLEVDEQETQGRSDIGCLFDIGVPGVDVLATQDKSTLGVKSTLVLLESMSDPPNTSRHLV